MKTRLNRPQPPSRSRSRLYRLAGSALILAAALLFVPLSLGALVSFAPRAALPVGALPARAGGGLDISKSAVPSVTVDQGGTIVYTLVVTNNTGVNLENLVVTDTVPANTTCQTISGPPGWFYNAGACAAGLARWRLPPLGGLALNDGQTALFSYTVQVNLPRANGTVIRNGAGSYGVTAEEKGGPGTFADAGPVNVDVTVNAPAWAIGKTASPSATVEAGNTVDYTLTVTNT
ncbi:MAG: hypothetical protein ACE5G8_13850, partial [Anaerolineae bacterium]